MTSSREHSVELDITKKGGVFIRMRTKAMIVKIYSSSIWGVHFACTIRIQPWSTYLCYVIAILLVFNSLWPAKSYGISDGSGVVVVVVAVGCGCVWRTQPKINYQSSYRAITPQFSGPTKCWSMATTQSFIQATIHFLNRHNTAEIHWH